MKWYDDDADDHHQYHGHHLDCQTKILFSFFLLSFFFLFLFFFLFFFFERNSKFLFSISVHLLCGKGDKICFLKTAIFYRVFYLQKFFLILRLKFLDFKTGFLIWCCFFLFRVFLLFIAVVFEFIKGVENEKKKEEQKKRKKNLWIWFIKVIQQFIYVWCYFWEFY